jgi:hypothetical protein
MNWPLMEICIGVLVAVIAFLAFRRRSRSPLRRTGPQTVKIHETSPSAIPRLRQNLRLKVGWDESKIERLIELERERMPRASLQVLMESAIERWERDNR